MGEKRIIVVLGMHRSGTSAIARGLLALGVDMGNNLMPALANDNEKGFWEDFDIYTLNMALMGYLGIDWQTLRWIDWPDIKQCDLDTFKTQAVDIISDKMRNVSIFGMKDPRITVLMPFWKEVFDYLNVAPCYVIAYRNPLSVAKSLGKRNGISLEKSCYLWLQYMIPSILDSFGYPRLVVSYDMLMDQPTDQLHRIAGTLKLPGKEGILESVEEFGINFLEENLRHTCFELSDLYNNSAIPGEVITAYEALEKLATDDISIDSQDIHKIFFQLQQNMRDMKPAFKYITNLELSIDKYEKNICESKHDEIISALNEVLIERDSQLTGINRLLAKRNEEITSLNRVIAEKDALLAAMSASRSWRITQPLRFLARLFRDR